MKYLGYYDSPLGPVTLAGDADSLTGLWFKGQAHYMAGMENEETCERETDAIRQTKKWLDIYFSGRDPGFIPPIKVEATPFRAVIADILLTIPFGSTLTYLDIARQAARRTGRDKLSARAAGNAVGHNPISLIIPCHRVIGAGGSLTGYAGGLEKKIWLLRTEGHTIEGMKLIR